MTLPASRASAFLLHSRFLFWLFVVLWVTRIFLVTAYYVRTADLGWYPPEADSIGIPIIGSFLLTVILAPILIVSLIRALRRSPPLHRRWFVWCGDRPFASTMWTLLFLACAWLAFDMLRESISIKLPLNAMASCCWIYFWLAMRAVVVSGLFPGVATSDPPLPEPGN